MDSAGEVLEALRRYAASAPTSAGLNVDSGDAAGELIALGKAAAVLDAALGAAMVRYDRLGAGSPAAILVQHAGLTRTHAANLRKLGRELDTDLPATRQRLTAGQIGTAQARSIIDLDEELANADTPVPQAARRQAETALADYATDATTTEVMRAARDARYRLTPETVEREMTDRYNARGITLSETFAGLTHITGLADPVTAATLNNHLNHHAGRRDHHDTRTTAARRLDALADAVTLADRITTQPDDDTPTPIGQAPHGVPSNGQAAHTAPTGPAPADVTPADRAPADVGPVDPASVDGGALQESCGESAATDVPAQAERGEVTGVAASTGIARSEPVPAAPAPAPAPEPALADGRAPQVAPADVRRAGVRPAGPAPVDGGALQESCSGSPAAEVPAQPGHEEVTRVAARTDLARTAPALGDGLAPLAAPADVAPAEPAPALVDGRAPHAAPTDGQAPLAAPVDVAPVDGAPVDGGARRESCGGSPVSQVPVLPGCGEVTGGGRVDRQCADRPCAGRRCARARGRRGAAGCARRRQARRPCAR